MSFPTEVVFAHPDAGYPGGSERARRLLAIGRVYTIRTVQVGRSDTSIELMELPGVWFSSVSFEPWWDEEDDFDETRQETVERLADEAAASRRLPALPPGADRIEFMLDPPPPAAATRMVLSCGWGRSRAAATRPWPPEGRHG